MGGSHEGTKARRVEEECFWISNLPLNWNTVRIKHGFAVIGSGTTPPSNQDEYYGGDTCWVNTSELREKII
jgi:type I restriction enzyme, S subunit